MPTSALLCTALLHGAAMQDPRPARARLHNTEHEKGLPLLQNRASAQIPEGRALQQGPRPGREAWEQRESPCFLKNSGEVTDCRKHAFFGRESSSSHAGQAVPAPAGCRAPGTGTAGADSQVQPPRHPRRDPNPALAFRGCRLLPGFKSCRCYSSAQTSDNLLLRRPQLPFLSNTEDHGVCTSQSSFSAKWSVAPASRSRSHQHRAPQAQEP